VVVLNLEVSFVFSRIREKLLELDLKPLGDVDEASTAHPGVLRVDLSGHEDALVHGLQSRIHGDRFARAHGDEPLTPLVGSGDLERVLAHLAGTMHEIADRDHERTRHMLSDHGSSLAAPS